MKLLGVSIFGLCLCLPFNMISQELTEAELNRAIEDVEEDCYEMQGFEVCNKEHLAKGLMRQHYNDIKEVLQLDVRYSFLPLDWFRPYYVMKFTVLDKYDNVYDVKCRLRRIAQVADDRALFFGCPVRGNYNRNYNLSMYLTYDDLE